MKKVIFVLLMCICMVSLAQADLVITNGDFETGGGVSITDVNGWYDNNAGGFWNDAWQTNASAVTPNDSNVVVFCSWDSVEGDPLAGSYLYQSIGTSSGESSITIAFDWGHPNDTAAGRLDGITVSVIASDGSFIANDANDVLDANGVTVLDYASYDHVALGTDDEIFPVVVTLGLSGAKAGDEIFLRFNNYMLEGGDPWPVLDNVQIISVESPLVIGDFEGDLDGWFSWADSNSTLEIGTTGATSGNNSLDLTVTGGYFQIGWAVPQGYVLDLSNVSTLELDVTMLVDNFPPDTWTKVDAMAINSELGWRQIGVTSVVDSNTGEEVASKDWGTWSGDSNRTIKWDIAAEGYDWTGFEDSSYQEIVISSIGNGVFHIDNIRLYGARLLPKIAWVSEMGDRDGDKIADDQGWIDLLTNNGYYVAVPPAKVDPNATYNPYWMVIDANKVAELNSASLVVISRNTNSGNYDEPNEPTLWNSVTTPTISLNAYLARNNRWKWMNSGGILDNIGAPLMEVIDTNHPIFKDVTYLSENIIDFLDPNVDSGRTTFINTTNIGNGVLIAQTLAGTETYIAEWKTGVEFYDGAGQIAGGRRMLFTSGIHSNTSGFGGNLNLTADGITVFLNAVDYMMNPVEETITVGSEADTYVGGDAVNGSLPYMYLRNTGNYAGYVRFSLAGKYITSIKSATLTLTVSGGVPGRNDNLVTGRFVLNGLNNVAGNTPQDWDEATLDVNSIGAEWSTNGGEPLVDVTVMDIETVTNVAGLEYSAAGSRIITVTGDALVQFLETRVDDDGLVTFILEFPGEGTERGYGIAAKEFEIESMRPVLEVTALVE